MTNSTFYALGSTAEEILAPTVVQPNQEEVSSLNLPHHEIQMKSKCLLFLWYHKLYE